MKISQYIIVKNSKENVLRFFYKLSKDPSIYKFDSHQGVFPIKGNIMEKGSVFETKETFAFVTLKLRFETFEVVSDEFFSFKLVKPSLGISGEFRVESLEGNKTKLYLTVFGDSKKVLFRIMNWFVFCSPIRLLVKNQTYSELVFLKSKMETKS